MSLRVAVIVGVVVAVLFVAVLALGGTQDEGSAREESEQEGGLLGLLGDRVGDPSLVSPDDVTAVCTTATPGRLQFTGICVLTVTNDGGGVRLLRLSPLSNFSVRAPAPEGDVTVESDVEPGDDTRVAVGEGTTEVELRCPTFATCQAQIVAG